jgi:hypothetical protein
MVSWYSKKNYPNTRFSCKKVDTSQKVNFVVSLKGTHPATPKAPQGDLYIEASTPNSGQDTVKKDSVKTVAALVK